MFNAQTPTDAAGNTLLNGSTLSVAIVQARFNENITSELASACKQELLALGVAAENIFHVTVPGALEIPCAIQLLMGREQYDAYVAIGCVIRGETFHFEIVAQESAAALGRLAQEYELPIINTILTTENLEQAQARQHVKGVEAARAAIEMANLAIELT